MYLMFEFLFYAGLGLLALGLFWLLAKTVRRDWSIWPPLILLLAGSLVFVTPLVLTRYVDEVDLGPRAVLVDGERHLTLTGWDQTDYQVLEAFPETIVLQIANADVTDQTLEYISGMVQLRELDLNDSQISDQGLEKIARLSGLQALRLRATHISDDGFARWIAPMSQLKQLDLRETSVSLDTVSGKRNPYNTQKKTNRLVNSANFRYRAEPLKGANYAKTALITEDSMAFPLPWQRIDL